MKLMRMNIYEKLDELFVLLDNNEDVQNILKLKEKITNKELELINNYRSNPSLENKKKLNDNSIIDSYLLSETKINYLIMAINQHFKRSKSCENHKW